MNAPLRDAVDRSPSITPRWDSVIFGLPFILSHMTKEQKAYVVDQDSSARKGIVRLLSKAGYQVVGFDSLEAYLASCEDRLTGCLILDATTIGLLDGSSLTALRDRCDLAVVLVIAADDDPVSRERAREMNAKAFLRKPVDGVALLDSIRWSLR